MNNIKQKFTIKDLESLSGVKAHTIRIWEKRYGLLEPKRTDTNIRYYDNEGLRKLLNVVYLNNRGVKISKLAQLSYPDLLNYVQQTNQHENPVDVIVDEFILAMLSYDESAFQHTYNKLLEQYTFSGIFQSYFLPLLYKIGLLWQTDTIVPAQEHFISNLIRQKLFSNIETVSLTQSEKDEVFVLFLPMGEIHELGLLYIHFELLQAGKKSIYLGPSIELEDLETFLPLDAKFHFVSAFTVAPMPDDIDSYLEKITNSLLDYPDVDFIFTSRNKTYNYTHPQIIAFENFQELLNNLVYNTNLTTK